MSNANRLPDGILGLDAGNKYGYVSLLDDPAKDPVALFPTTSERLARLSKLGMLTAAYVTPPSGAPIEVFTNGKAAEEARIRQPEQLVRAVKTWMGKTTAISVPGVDKPVNPDDIYAAVVRDLVKLACEERKNKGLAPCRDVVFTFPAVFADNAPLLERMQRSIERVEIDGEPLRVAGRLPEPAAVAIDRLYYMQHLAPEAVRLNADEFTVLVYDLGHGTFDAAVVTARSKGEPYKLHMQSGHPEVGGKNFDEILYNELCRQLRENGWEPRTPRDREAVLAAAVQAKLELTDQPVSVQQTPAGDQYPDVTVTLETFEALSEHLLTQTLEIVQNLLDEAEASGIRIDSIVLSGGASQMPMVKRGLEQLTEGKLPINLYRPSQAVSFGAARYAYGIRQRLAAAQQNPAPQTKPQPNPVLEQRTDCCYGIRMPAPGKPKGVEVRYLLKCGKTRPAVSETITFTAASPRIQVIVYRSKEKNRSLETGTPDVDAESMLWFPFDVTPGAVCTVRITAKENYDVEVELVTDKDPVRRKSTGDLMRDLI